MLQNARVTAFTVLELLWENSLVVELSQLRLGLEIRLQVSFFFGAPTHADIVKF